MIEVSKEKWDSIGTDYKGIWHDYWGDKPEWKGRKCVLQGCVVDNCDHGTALLIEGVHFIIKD